MADQSHNKHLQRSIKIGFQKVEHARQLQKAKKQLKRNHQPDSVRRKNWLGEVDDPNLAEVERVMPRGERERRRQVEALAQTDPEQVDLPAAETQAGLRGLVVEVSSGLCRVEAAGQIHLCRLRGSLSAGETGFTNVVAVGDEVLVSADEAGGGVVEQVLPRRTILARPDVFRSHLRQIIVANAEQLLIVAAWRNPPLWPELVDRYLIAAERYKLTPIICLNKIDLAEAEGSLAECQAIFQIYRSLGYQVILTSARTGLGVDTLRQTLQGRITALAGLSGVGKSSLLAAVQPGWQLRIGAVNEFSGEGRHTTTQVTLLPLAQGGYVADTPGIREFGLSGLSRHELIQFYPDLMAHAYRCRFADCSHRHEPDCAVKAALEVGTLADVRYSNYQKIYESLG